MSLSSPPTSVLSDSEACQPWNFRRAGQLDAEQQSALERFQARMAAGLTTSLTAHLGTAAPIAAAAALRLGYREWTEQAPPFSYLAAIDLGPGGGQAVLCLEGALALGLIDVLLGGPGEVVGPVREATSIEQRMLEAVGREAVAALQAAWPPELAGEFSFAGHRLPAALGGLLQPEEKAMVLPFTVQCGKAAGALLYVLPANLGSGLMRHLLQPTAPRPASAGDARSLLQQRMRAARFRLELVLPPSRVTMGQLLALHPGAVLPLSHSTHCAAQIKIAGQAMATAQTIRQDSRRAALVQMVCPPPARTPNLD